MTDFSQFKGTGSTKTGFDRDYRSNRQPDNKLKNFFNDVLEERGTNQESRQGLDRPSRGEHQDTSLYSGLSMSKSEDQRFEQYDKEGGASNNTSALLADNLEDDIDVMEGHKYQANNRKYDWDDEKEEDRVRQDKGRVSKRERISEHIKTENTDLSVDESFNNHGVYNRDTHTNYSNTKDYNFKVDDDRYGSDVKLYDTVKTEDFMRESPQHENDNKRRKQSTEQGLQFSKKSIEFGVLYPTEQREDTLELFNRGNEDMRLELRVHSQRSGARFYIATEDQDTQQESISLVINKYSFKKLRVSVETGAFGIEGDRERDINGAIIIKLDGERTEFPLVCRLENPSLQILGSSIDKMVGNVPFVNFDAEKLGRNESVEIPFRNNGKRTLLLEFELVGNPKLAEVIFSPKFLTLKEGEEKTLEIKPIRSFDYENRRKAILKYRIKGTRLCQCIVVNLA